MKSAIKNNKSTVFSKKIDIINLHNMIKRNTIKSYCEKLKNICLGCFDNTKWAQQSLFKNSWSFSVWGIYIVKKIRSN